MNTANNNDNNNEYKSDTVRRQQVIHPLDDDTNNNNADSQKKSDTAKTTLLTSVKDTDDDDIEKFGKTMDATGAMINNPTTATSLKHDGITDNKQAASTKTIIAKIKEIQDKIIKRTSLSNNKELEDRLKLMSSSATAASLSAAALQPTPQKVKNVSDVPGDRRKIIPEDVVDKILEKFQQLRSEAKHIALASPDDAAAKKQAPSTDKGKQYSFYSGNNTFHFAR